MDKERFDNEFKATVSKNTFLVRENIKKDFDNLGIKIKDVSVKGETIMKVLIACEFSGIVREAFKKCGHDAWRLKNDTKRI